jgi:hypothetical protein
MRACAGDAAARPVRIPYSRAPSLHRLRCGSPRLFTGFPRTMAEPSFSRPCITLYGPRPLPCGRRPAGGGRPEISCVACERCARMPGSVDDTEPPGARDPTRGTCCPLPTGGIGTPGGKFYRAQGWPTRAPVNASRAALAVACLTRGRCPRRRLRPLSLGDLRRSQSIPRSASRVGPALHHNALLPRGQTNRPRSRRQANRSHPSPQTASRLDAQNDWSPNATGGRGQMLPLSC